MDNKFVNLCSYIETRTVDEIVYEGMLNFFNIPKEEKCNYSIDFLKEKYNNEIFNELPTISYFEKSILDIKSHLKDYEWVYENLCDERSKDVFINLLYSKILMSIDYIQSAYTKEEMYFDDDLINYSNEVYVDCGGYNGDTVLKFIKHCIEFNKIYVYEAMPILAEILQRKFKYFIDDNSIIVRQKAVYNSEDELNFSEENCSGDSKISDSGNIKVRGCLLDKDIKERVSFIKMDLEGSEKEAIIGARKHIKNDNPKMAICIYHLEDDFRRIPKLIYEINPNYNFLIRHHSAEVYSETVLYCIPKLNNEIVSEKISNEIVINRYKNLLANSSIYLDEEVAINFNRTKDKTWYLRQLRLYKNNEQKLQKIINQLNGYISELNEGKSWLENQYKIIKNEKEELSKWVKEVQEGKDWLENQYKTEKNEKEELNKWVKEVQESKDWLENQYKIIKNEKEELNKWIKEAQEGKDWIENQYKIAIKEKEELSKWVYEVQEGKDWIEKQLNMEIVKQKELEHTNFELEHTNSELEKQLIELKNHNSKLLYKLNILKEDKLISRIIKFKKYSI